MELDENFIKADWTEDDNGNPKFFIINEAVISKLCILGENFEPCFEGSQITKLEFAFDEGFKTELFNFMKLMQENLKEGGAPVFTKYSVVVGDALWTALYSNIDNDVYAINGVFTEGEQTFAVLQNREDKSFSRMNFSFIDNAFAGEELFALDAYEMSESQFNAEEVEAFETEFKKKKEEEKDDKKPPFLKDKEDDSEKKSEDKKSEDKDSGDKKSEDKKSEDKDSGDKKSEDKKPEDKKEESKDDESEDDEDKKKKKKKYNLEEVEEYTELQNKYNELNTNYANATAKITELEAQIVELTQFKNSVDRKAKEELINTEFCMLDAEDKKDVIENIDTYSLDDIEAKLAVIAVRKKVNFSLDRDDQNKDGISFNLDGIDDDDSTPAWIKAVKATAKSMNE